MIDTWPPISTTHKAIEETCKIGNLIADTTEYITFKDSKFASFQLLPKILKRLCDVSGRLVISVSGYYTENIYSFLEFHLQPLSCAVKSCMNDT